MEINDEESMNCPRCEATLRKQALHEVEVFICGSCLGSMVEQRKLIALLAGMSSRAAGRRMQRLKLGHPFRDPPLAATAEAEPEPPSFDQSIEHMPDAGGVVSCPRCERAMERHGYMGSSIVQIDSCGACRVVWNDADELKTMMALFIKTEGRAEERAYEDADPLYHHGGGGALGASAVTESRGDLDSREMDRLVDFITDESGQAVDQ